MTDLLPVPRSVVRPLWIAVAVVMTLDGLTTYLALTHVAGAAEASPTMATAIHLAGVGPAMTAKALAGTLIAWMLARRAVHGYRHPWAYRVRVAWWLGPVPAWKVQRSAVVLLVISLTLTAGVVGNNLHAILRP